MSAAADKTDGETAKGVERSRRQPFLDKCTEVL